MNIKLRHLQAFRCIVETGSVSEAASLMGLTQSSVSKLLAGFEREVGFAVFERVGRRLRLSQKGRAFLDRTANAVELLDDIRTVAEDIRANLGQRMRISAIGPLAFSALLPGILRRFSDEFPDFTYTVDMKLRAEIEDWLLGGHSDIGFTLLPATRAAIASREFVRTRAVCIVPEGHRFAGRPALDPLDLEGEDIVLPRSAVRFRMLIEADFVKAGVNLRPRFETSNAISLAALVAEGLGVAVVDPFSLTLSDMARIRAVPWAPGTALSYGMIWPDHREPTPQETAIFGHAAGAAAELLGEVERRTGLALDAP